MKMLRVTLALLPLAACGGTSASPAPPTELVSPEESVWTETSLDNAIVTELDGCHVRSETRARGESRVRERWEAPGWSFALARVDGETVQARVRVTRGSSQLDVFAVLPVADAPEPSALLVALAHPRRALLPESSRLIRVYREERDGEAITLEETGGREFRARSLTRERDEGETFEIRAGTNSRVQSRAWVDERGRHYETYGLQRSVSSALEERDANGRVVAEHQTMTGYGNREEWTTELSYDDAGRLIGVGEETIEVTAVGDTTRTCTEYYCVTKDREGRLLAAGRPGSEPTTTIRRDERGRVVEVRHVHDDETRTATIRRNTDGHRLSVVANDYTITGEWDGARLTQSTTRVLHEGEMVEAVSRVRTYDEHARVIRSLVVEQGLGSANETRRSETLVTYARGCAPSIEIVLEPEHRSPLESPFELID